MPGSGMILVAVILMDLLTGIEFDLFVPSFPALQTQFHLSAFWVEALLSVNFIGYCLSLVFIGGLSDRYGRKPIILLGLIIFIIGSILCLMGTFYPFLLLGRFLQGVGIAAPAILSFLIIADAYELKKQQFFMAMLNGVMNTSVAFAPVVGSYITLYFHWQGNFITLLGVGLITFMMSALVIPNKQLPKKREKDSGTGYIQLLKSKPLLLLIGNIVFCFMPYWVFVGIAPLLYMKNLGISLTHFGYYQGVLALVFAIGSIILGFTIHKFEQKKMLSVTAKIYMFSLISILLVTFFANTHALLITLAFLPFIISQIIPSVILYPLCLNFFPEAKGRISAILQGSRLILSALALAICGYFYQGTFLNVGIMLSIFIVIVLITHYFVLRNPALMK